LCKEKKSSSLLCRVVFKYVAAERSTFQSAFYSNFIHDLFPFIFGFSREIIKSKMLLSDFTACAGNEIAD